MIANEKTKRGLEVEYEVNNGRYSNIIIQSN